MFEILASIILIKKFSQIINASKIVFRHRVKSQVYYSKSIGLEQSYKQFISYQNLKSGINFSKQIFTKLGSQISHTLELQSTIIKDLLEYMQQDFNQGHGFNQIETSPWYGGNGGSPGEHKGPNYSLIGVRGRSGDCIDRIQFFFLDVNTGQIVETPAVGGNGGSSFQFFCPPGQWIDKIRIRYKQVLTNLMFKTNTGFSSTAYGSHQGKQEYFNVSGKRITGVSWRCGSLIDGLQFHYTS